LSGNVSWRLANKGDRSLLQRFRCADDEGPAYERLVQRYFRTQAISHMGAVDSVRSDHRLLLILDGEELVAAGCHRRGPDPNQRYFIFAAVEKDRQGQRLSNGERASDVLWNIVASDILDREGDADTLVFARVDPENQRSLAYCRRIGLIPIEQGPQGLVICAGPIARR
jgi:hypothetical protein